MAQDLIVSFYPFSLLCFSGALVILGIFGKPLIWWYYQNVTRMRFPKRERTKQDDAMINALTGFAFMFFLAALVNLLLEL